MPSNLTRQALRDRDKILELSAKTYGEAKSTQLRAILDDKCQDIAAGSNLGHGRPDIPAHLPFRFLTIWPFIIVYDPGSRLVVRIVDGRRDFTPLFSGA